MNISSWVLRINDFKIGPGTALHWAEVAKDDNLKAGVNMTQFTAESVTPKEAAAKSEDKQILVPSDYERGAGVLVQEELTTTVFPAQSPRTAPPPLVV